MMQKQDLNNMNANRGVSAGSRMSNNTSHASLNYSQANQYQDNQSQKSMGSNVG